MTKWSGDSSSPVRVGLDLSVSGTKITAKYYAGSGYSGGVDDDEVMNGWGAIDFKQSFHNSSSEGSPQLVATKTMTGTRGKTYSFGAKITGVYTGAVPSVTDDIKVPAAVPNKMSRPSVSSITSSSATVSWSKPSGNGATVTGAQIQVDNSSGFGSPVEDYFDGESPSYPNGMAANTVYYVRMRAKNSVGYGPWSDTVSFRTKVQAPSAPSIGTPVRNSDTSITVKWSRNVSTARPYEKQEVYRRYYTGSGWSSWTRIAAVSSTATSYTWGSASQGHVYQFLVKAINDAGSANSSDSGNVYTTPDAPTSVKATKNAAGNIVLTWEMGNDSGSIGSSIGFDIQESAGGGAWTTRVSGVEAKTWTHSAPSATVTHQYRVRTRIIASGLPGSGLASGYVNSGVVQLLTPPNAPTGLKYTPTGIVDRTLPITLAWTHNPIDSSDQTKFQVRHREVGTTTWTTVPVVNSGLETWTLPGNSYLEATQVEWQVMTWGLHPTGSPWSASNTISLSSQPEVTIDYPAQGEVIDIATMSPVWSFADAESEEQVGWEIRLTNLSTNTLVESKVGADDSSTATFENRIKDGSTYEIGVRVKDAAGLWSPWATADITVEYALPPVPVIDATVWDPNTASVDVQFHVPDPEAGQAEVDHFEVWRRIDDGEWRLLTNELPADADDYIDNFPTVSGRNTYLVVAMSSIPSESQSALTFVSRKNYARNARPSGAASGSGITGFANYGAGPDETGTTMTTDAPLTGVARTNRFTNPSFETNLTSVINNATSVVSRLTSGSSSTLVYSGACSMRVEITGVDPYNYVGQAMGTVVPGEYAAARFMVRTSGSTAKYAARILFYDAGGAQVASAAWGTVVTGVAGVWSEVRTGDALVPAGAATARAYLYQGDTTASSAVLGVVYTTDAWMAVTAPSAAEAQQMLNAGYFDGSSTMRDVIGDRRYTYGFTGTAHGSTSVEYLSITPNAATPNGTGFARRVVTTAKTSGSTGWQARTSSYFANIVGASGDWITVSLLERYLGTGVFPSKASRLRIEFWDNGSLVGSSDAPYTDLTDGDWVLLEHKAQAPGDFTNIGWWTYQVSGPYSTMIFEPGSAIDAGDVLIERGGVLGQTWFDGDSEAHDDITYDFLGTDYLSDSVELTPISVTYVDTPQEGDIQALWLNPRGLPSLAARLFHNVTLTATPSLEKVLNHYAGRPLPVESTGIREDTSWAVSGKLHLRWAKNLDDPEQPDIWEEIGRTPGPHLLRSVEPRKHEWVSISGLSVDRNQGGNVYDVSFTATKVSAP